MGLTVRQLIEELGGTPGTDDELNKAVVLLETDEGWNSVENPTFHRQGLPDTESDMPVVVLEDGGEVIVE